MSWSGSAHLPYLPRWFRLAYLGRSAHLGRLARFAHLVRSRRMQQTHYPRHVPSTLS